MKIDKSCLICRSGFQVPKCREKSAKYCSKECQHNSLKLPNNTRCSYCKKEFYLKKYRIKRAKKNYCSTKCFNLHKKELYLGKGNPNKKYNYDEDFFKSINSEEKAYLLGWIVGDGHIGDGHIKISIRRQDVDIIKQLRDIFYKNLPITNDKSDMVGFSICSKKIIKDVCNILNLKTGKKSDKISLPRFESDFLTWAFIRGYFDADGCVDHLNQNRSPRGSIASNSLIILEQISEFSKIKSHIYKSGERGFVLAYTGNNAIDFLNKIYQNAKYKLDRKYKEYLDWCLWVPCLSGSGNHGRELLFRWNKCTKEAVPPFKERASDSGYDLTILSIKNKIGLVTFYDTGIKIKPEYGWYFDLVPRGSITKSGYILANSVGVIDRTYVGSILVPLMKIDPEAPDLTLPSRIVQIIPRPIIHIEWEEVDFIEDTDRGKGRLGSTGALNT